MLSSQPKSLNTSMMTRSAACWNQPRGLVKEAGHIIVTTAHFDEAYIVHTMLTASAILAIPIRITFFTYSLFFAGFFFFSDKPEHYEYYYWTVLPFAAILAPIAFKQLKSSPLFWLVFAYTVYMFAASAWSQPFLIDDFLFHSRCILYVLSFIVVTVVLLHEYPNRFEMLLKITCACAAITAVAGIALWYSEHAFPGNRLLSVGKFQAPIESACAFGFFGLLALHYALREKTPALRIGFGVCMILIFAFIIFGQSRSGIAAFIDAEHALDPIYAQALGVDIDSLYVSQPDTGEQALEITRTDG